MLCSGGYFQSKKAIQCFFQIDKAIFPIPASRVLRVSPCSGIRALSYFCCFELGPNVSLRGKLRHRSSDLSQNPQMSLAKHSTGLWSPISCCGKQTSGNHHWCLPRADNVRQRKDMRQKGLVTRASKTRLFWEKKDQRKHLTVQPSPHQSNWTGMGEEHWPEPQTSISTATVVWPTLEKNIYKLWQ